MPTIIHDHAYPGEPVRYDVQKIENITTGAATLRGHVETAGGYEVARHLAVKHGLIRDFEAFRVEEACDCGAIVPGALYPWAPGGDGSLPFVERCDVCKRFATDDDAAVAVAEKIGGRVAWAALEGESQVRDHVCPFVLPMIPETLEHRVTVQLSGGDADADEALLIEIADALRIPYDRSEYGADGE